MLLSEIMIQRTGDETFITLPPRDLSSLSRYGWIGIAFGIFGILFMCSWIGTPLFMAISEFRNGNFFVAIPSLLFALVGLPGIWFSVKILRIGIGIRNNDTSTTIKISPKQFVIREHIGGARWNRKFKNLPSNRLVIDHLKDKEGNVPFQLSDDLFVLAARSSRLKSSEPSSDKSSQSSRSEKPLPLVIGYPRPIIDQVVEALQKAAGQGELSVEVLDANDSNGISSRSSNPSRSISVEDESSNEPSTDRPPLEQPDHSKIVVQRLEHATVYKVPAVGILKVGMLFWFAILWLSFCSIFFPIIFVSAFNAPQNDPMPLMFMIPFAGLFFTVGIAILVGAINVGRRTCTIGVANGLLWIERISIFGKKVIEVESPEIKTICIGPSGTTVNDVPILELQIHQKGGAKHGLLSQINDDEIEWLVDRLIRELEI